MRIALPILALLITAQVFAQERRPLRPGAAVPALMSNDRGDVRSRRTAKAVPPRPADSPRQTAQPPHIRRGAVVFTVNSAYDDDPDTNGDGTCGGATFGECQLRSAILEANAQPDHQPVRIEFGITTGPAGSEMPADTWTITLSHDEVSDGDVAPLPAVFQPGLTIDALTQPEADCGDLVGGVPHDLRVILDGTNLASPSHSALDGVGADFTVRGLVVQNFPGFSISTYGSRSLVECSYIGTEVDGTTAAPNAGGVVLGYGAGAADSGITNSLISANTFEGVRIDEMERGFATSNLIGTDERGRAPLGNGGSGLQVTFSPDARIDGNVISANSIVGLWLRGSTTTGAKVYGNFVGLSRIREREGVGNGNGIEVTDGARTNEIGVFGEADNWIADNRLNGIQVRDEGTDDNRIQGNRIGFNISGVPAPNGLDGINVAQTPTGGPERTMIGGYSGGGIGNLISNNSRDGIRSVGVSGLHIVGNSINRNAGNGITLMSHPDSGPTVGAVIEANTIGVDGGGNDRGNDGYGVHCIEARDSSLGNGTGYGNDISFNGDSGEDGVRAEAGCSDLTLLYNRISDNDGLGIDRGPDGVTPNDDPESDLITNHPDLTTATNDGSQSVVEFGFVGLPGEEYLVQVFVSDAPDPSGFGEGHDLATSTQFAIGPSGQVTIPLVHPASVFPLGRWVTATATPLDATSPTGFGGTSEFSRAIQVTEAAPSPPFSVSIRPLDSPPPVVVAAGSRFDYEITIAASPDGPGGEVEVWTQGRRPSGGTTGMLLGPRTLSLAPGETHVIEARQRVPRSIAPGDYEYLAFVGEAPDAPVDTDEFDVQVTATEAVTAGRQTHGGDWEVEVLSETRLGSHAGLPVQSTLSTETEPSGLELAPNPSRGAVSVQFSLAEASDVRLAVYDALGRSVAVLAEGAHAAGTHEVRFDASALPAGVYLVRLNGTGLLVTRSLTLSR